MNASPSTPVDPIELAEFVITWTGYAIAFLSVVAGLLAILGFKELRDIRETKDRILKIESKITDSYNNITKQEQETKKSLDDLEARFRNSAQNIINGAFYYSLGVDSYKRGRYSEAINSLNESLLYVPDNTRAICLIGRAYTYRGNREIAFHFYERALAIDKDCAEAYRSLAAWYRYTSIRTALDNAKKAQELAPHNIEYLNYYSLLLRDNGQPSESLSVLWKSYGIERHPNTDFFLAILYLSENSIGRAKIHIESALNGYDDEQEYGVTKPVWKEMAKWIQILTDDKDEERFAKAIEQLTKVRSSLDSEKQKTVVLGHIDYVVKAITDDESYYEQCKGIFDV